MQETNKIFLSNRIVVFILLFHFYSVIDRIYGLHLSNIIVHSNQQSKMYGEFTFYLFCILIIPSIIALIKNKFDGYSILIILYIICLGWFYLVAFGWGLWK